MRSAVIPSALSYPAVRLAPQPVRAKRVSFALWRESGNSPAEQAITGSVAPSLRARGAGYLVPRGRV